MAGGEAAGSSPGGAFLRACAEASLCWVITCLFSLHPWGLPPAPCSWGPRPPDSPHGSRPEVMLDWLPPRGAHICLQPSRIAALTNSEMEGDPDPGACPRNHLQTRPLWLLEHIATKPGDLKAKKWLLPQF